MKRIAFIGVTLFAGSACALEINDVYDVNVASGASQTISEAITGSGSIRKTGAGTLVLSGANTFTGGVSIEAGRVEVAATGRSVRVRSRSPRRGLPARATSASRWLRRSRTRSP